MSDLMKEDEIASIEATCEDYGLENYPINGAQVAALVRTLRFYEKGCSLAMPHLIHAMDRQRWREASNKWALPNLGVLMLTLFACFGAMAFTGAQDRFHVALRSPDLEGFWPALVMVVGSCLIPFLVIFLPGMAWIDRRMKADIAKKETTE